MADYLFSASLWEVFHSILRVAKFRNSNMSNFVLLRKDFYLSGVWRSFLYLWGGRIIRICRYNPSIIQIVNCVMKLLSRPTRVILMENTKKYFFVFIRWHRWDFFFVPLNAVPLRIVPHIFQSYEQKFLKNLGYEFAT